MSFCILTKPVLRERGDMAGSDLAPKSAVLPGQQAGQSQAVKGCVRGVLSSLQAMLIDHGGEPRELCSSLFINIPPGCFEACHLGR